MTTFEHVDTLNSARAEILSLRRTNEIMEAKLEGIEMAMYFLNTTPAISRPMCAMPDVVNSIDKAIATLQS